MEEPFAPEEHAPARPSDRSDRGDAWEPPTAEPDEDAPRDGRQLLGWASKQIPDLKGVLTGYGKKKGLHSKIVEWTPQQVAAAYRESQAGPTLDATSACPATPGGSCALHRTTRLPSGPYRLGGGPPSRPSGGPPIADAAGATCILRATPFSPHRSLPRGRGTVSARPRWGVSLKLIVLDGHGREREWHSPSGGADSV